MGGQGSGVGVLQRQAAGERRNRPATGGKESPPQPPEVRAEGRWADNNERRLEGIFPLLVLLVPLLFRRGPGRNPKWGRVSFSVRASAAPAPATGCDAAGDGGWGWRRPPCRRSCGTNTLTASSGDAFPSPANSCSHLLRSCLERRAATSSCSPSPSCRLITAPHGGRGERGLWRLMSKREACLPSGSEGPSSPQPMTPCRPPHLIEASSSSAKVACRRQRSSDVLRSGHGVLHFAVTYMCS
ncbi:uncharacterized protein LOC127759912 [Oryza glaberrima]|uniref:uncharacterized protein LOC127759912 n=1 Tax=Oryza glaberrima TaxID=4538 RepID=UPI00224C5235|nr:uncharacterized protein LOC127759912 [Oryza glaberrima]